MKKLITVLSVAFVLVFLMAFAVSAETITVTDDGTNVVLGDCVIEGLDREIPKPSSGFTFQLDTETKTAKITKWDNYADSELGKVFCMPSTVTYGGVVYTVTSFDRVVFFTDNGNGNKNSGNYILRDLYVGDTCTAIPASAFNQCRALENVIVGKNVESIGAYAFSYAGFTGAPYYMDDGTGKMVRSETLGIHIGNIKNFIWTTRKITTLPEQSFFHIDFDPNTVINFPFELITTYGSKAVAYNGFAFNGQYNNGGWKATIDIRNATSIANDAFEKLNVNGGPIILNADQVHLVSPNKSAGGDILDVQHSYIIYGGETPQSAKTLSAGIWTINATAWGDKFHFNIIFKGYVNAYDGVEGLENQNAYGTDFIDYIFDSKTTMEYFIDSISSTTKAADTLARYAKSNKGYFNYCTTENGAHVIKAFDLVKNAETGEYALVENTNTKYIPTVSTKQALLDDDCTESTICLCCSYAYVKGLEHENGTTYEYANGYTENGLKVVGCTRCLKGTETVLAPLFVSYGYSKDEKGVGIVHTIKVDKIAIAAYEELLGEKDGEAIRVYYGIVAAIANGSESAPITADGQIVENYKAVAADMTNTEYSLLSIKICGIDDAETALNCNVYVIVDGKVNYINDDKTSDYAKSVKYSEL